jgi:hypothetical protein
MAAPQQPADQQMDRGERRIMKRKLLWIMALLAVAATIAGCGNDGGSSESGTTGNGVYNNVSTGVKPVIRQE